MRSWPARFTASASSAVSITLRDTSPRRRLACMDALRSMRKASSSLSAPPRIRMPLARSTHLRSSIWACALSSARRRPCTWAKRARPSATAAGQSGTAVPVRQALTPAASASSIQLGSAGAPSGHHSSTGRGRLASWHCRSGQGGACAAAATTSTCGACRTVSCTRVLQTAPCNGASPAARRLWASASASARLQCTGSRARDSIFLMETQPFRHMARQLHRSGHTGVTTHPTGAGFCTKP